MRDLKLGIVEFGNRGDETSIIAVEQIIEYAIAAETNGYSRFWLGEHHGADPRIPFTNPEILLTVIAGMTNRIRIGTAGTMVRLYNSYSLLTNFKMMNNLFDNRVDLGLAKGKPELAFLNSEGSIKKNTFSDKMEELVRFVNSESEEFDKNGVVIPPYFGSPPNLWYLSNSYKNFDDITFGGMNLCRSIMHGLNLERRYDKDLLLAEKDRFYKRNGKEIEVCLALGFSLSKDIEKSKKLIVDYYNADGISPEQAWNIIPTTPEHLFDLLYDFQNLYGIDEFILYDSEVDNTKKIDNLRIISEKFNIQKLVNGSI